MYHIWIAEDGSGSENLQKGVVMGHSSHWNGMPLLRFGCKFLLVLDISWCVGLIRSHIYVKDWQIDGRVAHGIHRSREMWDGWSLINHIRIAFEVCFTWSWQLAVVHTNCVWYITLSHVIRQSAASAIMDCMWLSVLWRVYMYCALALSLPFPSNERDYWP